ncbi:redoxin domain-containing protein [Paenisporosarcina sp. TG20]|uniref:redoxin domain-containing protein n=1 Tax=Paenisporosarcina sp. TG20 TaxID=1211706 RepID=UPI0002E348AC|nr:redoxin domain-containing protein [Paenisporosarcina sp. TG20]
MTKKNLGLIFTGLIIGTLLFLTVKSNVEKMEPNESFATVTTIDTSFKEESGLKKGDIAPDFELSTLNGDMVKLSNYRGRKVILNFWATWCAPCKTEMPHMENYYKKNKDSANVEIIAINMTTADRPGIVKKFVDSYGLTFPIPLDVEGKAMDAYQIIPLPTTYMINTDGTIAHLIRGPVDEKLLKELVKTLE